MLAYLFFSVRLKHCIRWRCG